MSRITIQTKEKRFPVAPDLYGLFFEDINRAGDSGLYPEMLRNRSFEDSIPPERCTLNEDGSVFTTPMGWSDQFNNGEGLKKWMHDVPPTPIPAWYAEHAEMRLDAAERLNPKRLTALKVAFETNGMIYNIGYQGIPLKKGESCHFYMFAKSVCENAVLQVAIASEDGTIQDQTEIMVKPGCYERYDSTFTATADDFKGKLLIKAPEACTVCFGFTSLMPSETYKGHGMRKDLMELLEHTNSKFLRFPGGCIVEGFTYETAMRFPNTIGPVWERPSHVLMWHYRTTNGLGFHEYLQICEDLDLEPMYVINCGLTCQGREPEFFEGDELEQLLQEALDAVEYAIGDASTPMGRKRAEAGHPEPFKLSYIEIGNENSGEEYYWRYKKFYDVLKAKYPQIHYVSNTHTEHAGLPTEMADEHYYDTPEFFLENTHMYDNYDRKGPDIFVGEYAVTVGKVATLRCALAESAFLLGVENNQDIVTTTAYAPLFQNTDYTAWYPNLIAFDNHRAYGIPTYHALSLLAGNRGKEAVTLNTETDLLHRIPCGLPAISSTKDGLHVRNVTINGQPADISCLLEGKFIKQGDEYITASIQPEREKYDSPGANFSIDAAFAAFGSNTDNCCTFEAEIQSTPDNPFALAVWCHHPQSVFRIDETTDPDKLEMDSMRCFKWTVNDHTSSVSEYYYKRHTPMGDNVMIDTSVSEYHHYKVVTREDGFDCYIDGELVHRANLPNYPAITASASVTDDEVIVKLVNITDRVQPVEIALDCEVESDYRAEILTSAHPEDENTLDQPERVSPVAQTQSGAAQKFTYQAPAYSLNVLVLKRK